MSIIKYYFKLIKIVNEQPLSEYLVMAKYQSTNVAD